MAKYSCHVSRTSHQSISSHEIQRCPGKFLVDISRERKTRQTLPTTHLNLRNYWVLRQGINDEWTGTCQSLIFRAMRGRIDSVGLSRHQRLVPVWANSGNYAISFNRPLKQLKKDLSNLLDNLFDFKKLWDEKNRWVLMVRTLNNVRALTVVCQLFTRAWLKRLGRT